MSKVEKVGVYDITAQIGEGGMGEVYRSKAIDLSQRTPSPFFSPDGQWIGFSAQAKLKKISVAAGSARWSSRQGTTETP